MKKLKLAVLVLAVNLLLGAGLAQGKVDTLELYTNAVMAADVPVLEKVLAPNFWFIGASGHIRDKEHFIQEIKDKKLVITRLSLTNNRETQLGDTRLVTSNGVFHGAAMQPTPQGLMRFTTVLANNKGEEQVVLFQATPVIPTHECVDGNCKIK